MRAFDWSDTPLGSPAGWPDTLRTTLGICLTSRFPLHVWWGPDLTLFYNDAYIPLLGPKHPAVLGQSGYQAWAEIWTAIGPMIRSVLESGVASWAEDVPMFLDRELPREEVYITFSFSPVFGKRRQVDGLLCACTETTDKVLGQRRSDTLRRLALEARPGRGVADVQAAIAGVLGGNPGDLPAAALYLVDDDQLRAVEWIGMAAGAAELPLVVPVIGEPAAPRSRWPLGNLDLERGAREVALDMLPEPLHAGPWQEPIRDALVLPVRTPLGLAGALVCAVNPRRPLDAAYRAFFDRVAEQVAAVLAEPWAREDERRRAGPARPQRRALVADADPEVRAHLMEVLAADWRVEAVGDGPAALDAVRRAPPPDIVLAGVALPGLDGFGLVAGMRADPGTAQIPIVLLSAPGDEDVRKARELGADDHLTRPFTAREVRARLRASFELSQLRLELNAAHAASRAKDQFLAMLGHELRNPLSPIVTVLEVMRLRGPQSQDLGVLERSVTHLKRLVDDLMDVSRIASGKLELRRRVVPLGEALRRAVEIATPAIDGRRQRLLLQVQPNHVLVDVDADRIAQVFANLLVNASKFSDERARIIVELEQVDGRVHVRVADEGVGIDGGIIQRVFDPFVQDAHRPAGATDGLGLGLAISRRIVEAHGGSIAVRSDGPGKGSVFSVELPVADGTSRHAVADAPSRAHPALQDRRILVVDDNHAAAISLKVALEHLGYTVEIAFTGEEAVAVAPAFAPDVALLDIGLPGMNGYELAQRLRGLDPRGTLHLIAVTGFGQASDRRTAIEAGFEEHLVKPVELARLQHVVEQLAS